MCPAGGVKKPDTVGRHAPASRISPDTAPLRAGVVSLAVRVSSRPKIE